ncbi:hypothetical protein, partial [Pseudomonas sp. FW305-33]|uniref:hypothetical protein n=1 Tax=Pseudomonas sp. FW305-33 TaxID=2751337 RepID=UPI001A937F73
DLLQPLRLRQRLSIGTESPKGREPLLSGGIFLCVAVEVLIHTPSTVIFRQLKYELTPVEPERPLSAGAIA